MPSLIPVAFPKKSEAVFSLFLGKATGISEGIEHYGLFVFAGMVAWTFFSNTVTAAANSIVANERLVTKIYFPRLIIPLSTVGVGLFDFGIASFLLMLMAAGYGVIPSWWIIFFPIVVFTLAVTAAGIGVLLSALIVTQRDFKYVLSFGMQLWMFATPCLYMSPASISDRAAIWLPLNPAHGLIKTFRQVCLGGEFDAYAFGVSAGVGTFVAVVGLLYFRRVEQTFADNI